MPSPIEELRRIRLEKLEALKKAGVNPFPNKFERNCSISQAREKKLGSNIKTAGRIVAWRSHGALTFADLWDAGGKIQLLLKEDELPKASFKLLALLDLGDFLGVGGELFKTKAGELTILVKEFTILAKSLHPLPDKLEGLKEKELRFRKRYLDLIANETSRQTLVARSRITAIVRHYLDSLGFLEVETPILQPVYGGAAAEPFTTRYEALNHDFYLRIADELYLKRLIVGGLEKVYEIGKDFRNEGIDATHSPEFTQMECYAAYSDLYGMMEIVEGIYRKVAEELFGKGKITYQGKTLDFTKKWQRLPYAVAPKDDKGEVDGGKIWDPTFVVDWPRETTTFAKAKPGSPNLVERFEPFVGGMELGNAYTELNDPLLQRRLLEEQKNPVDEDFLEAMEYGMPPMGGLGLGIDRLAMIFTDQDNIREVIAFPALKPEND